MEREEEREGGRERQRRSERDRGEEGRERQAERETVGIERDKWRERID